METPEIISTSLQAGVWVTSIDFKRPIFLYTSPKPVLEVHAFSCPGSVLKGQSTHGVHSSGERGQTDCLTKGYKNTPVPRGLVGQSQIEPNLSPSYTDSSGYLSRVRLAGEHGEIRTGPQISLRLHRLPD